LEVLRAATAPLEGVDEFVFKGGTSLSKAYGIIERFSEDIDLLVITPATETAQTAPPNGCRSNQRRARHRARTRTRRQRPPRRPYTRRSAPLRHRHAALQPRRPRRTSEPRGHTRTDDRHRRSHRRCWMALHTTTRIGIRLKLSLYSQPDIADALASGYARLDDLVWGHRPSLAQAIDIVRTYRELI
jgi:Nucleotidyl transferase AbiEii toxin, Type IV TA system